jgi:hypothetical protein
MNPSYITTNQEELFDAAPPEIQELIVGGEVEKTTAILGKSYKLPISSYIAFSNIISFILIGALKTEDVLIALEDILKLSPEDSYKLAQDLDKTILEKARIKILGKSTDEIVTLTFNKDHSAEELRKEILDTTKRESGFIKKQSKTEEKTTNENPTNKTSFQKKSSIIIPGSHSQLIEQLQVLESIPNDEEIATRLNHIKEQLASLDKKDPRELDSNIALKEFMSEERENGTVEAKQKTAPYSKAPTSYNIDPYKEILED